MDAVESLRVVLVHDWLTGMRGGEKVLEVLCRRWPEAPLYTLLHLRGSSAPHWLIGALHGMLGATGLGALILALRSPAFRPRARRP